MYPIGVLVVCFGRHIIYHKEILPTTHCIRLAMHHFFFKKNLFIRLQCAFPLFFCRSRIQIYSCFNGLIWSLFCSAEQPSLLRFLWVINLKASVQQKRYTMARLYVTVVIGYIYHLNMLLLACCCLLVTGLNFGTWKWAQQGSLLVVIIYLIS